VSLFSTFGSSDQLITRHLETTITSYFLIFIIKNYDMTGIQTCKVGVNLVSLIQILNRCIMKDLPKRCYFW
jgi:hypothetical protein